MNDQTMNYMDYVDDRCMSMYTQGQADRMNFYLQNVRSALWTPANMTASGCDGTFSPCCAPIADFSADNVQCCAGSLINFSDESMGAPTS